MTDNTLGKARGLGILDGRTAIRRDALNRRDRVDFYKFTLNRSSSVNLQLSGLRSNADLILINSSGQPIVRSIKGGKQAEQISRNVAAGTYYVKVLGRSNKTTSYRLAASATPLPGNPGTPPPSPPISTPLPPPVPARYLTQVTSDGSRILRLNTTTGTTSVLAIDRSTSRFDDYLEIASFGNDLFVSKGAASSGILGSFGGGLYKIDPSTGTETFVGDFGVKNINSNDNKGLDAMGFTSSGNLYGVFNFAVREGSSAASAKLFPAFYSIDKNTGQATFISQLPETQINQGIDDIVFDPTSGRFLASFYRGDSRFGKLLSIGLAGDVQDLGFLPETRLTGMFFQSGTLNGFNGNRRIALDFTRKKNIGDGPLVIEVFESTELPFAEPNNERGAVIGAG